MTKVKRIDDTVPVQHGNFFWRRVNGIFRVYAKLGDLDSGAPIFEARWPKQGQGRYTNDIEQAAIWALPRFDGERVTRLNFGDITLPIDSHSDLERLQGLTIRGRRITCDDVDALTALVAAIELGASLASARSQRDNEIREFYEAVAQGEKSEASP